MDEIIDMKDMAEIYEIIDELQIDRESINVELAKEDPGGWKFGYGGMIKKQIIEITVPQTVPLREWLPVLKFGLKELLGGKQSS